jgi:hypothetical protein
MHGVAPAIVFGILRRTAYRVSNPGFTGGGGFREGPLPLRLPHPAVDGWLAMD